MKPSDVEKYGDDDYKSDDFGHYYEWDRTFPSFVFPHRLKVSGYVKKSDRRSFDETKDSLYNIQCFNKTDRFFDGLCFSFGLSKER